MTRFTKRDWGKYYLEYLYSVSNNIYDNANNDNVLYL